MPQLIVGNEWLDLHHGRSWHYSTRIAALLDIALHCSILPNLQCSARNMRYRVHGHIPIGIRRGASDMSRPKEQRSAPVDLSQASYNTDDLSPPCQHSHYTGTKQGHHMISFSPAIDPAVECNMTKALPGLPKSTLITSILGVGNNIPGILPFLEQSRSRTPIKIKHNTRLASK